MRIGDEPSFQKRHHLFKYLGGLKEFPSIVTKNIRKNSRTRIVDTLTEVYRAEARLYEGIADLIRTLIAAPDVVVGLVTRNITNEPLETLRQLFMRHDIDIGELDFVAAISTGMHPFMVSYGFEDHDRLTTKFDIPHEVISRTSDELCRRVRHALELDVTA